MYFILKSSPIVDIHSLWIKRESKQDFPTPESPNNVTLNRKSYVLFRVAILHMCVCVRACVCVNERKRGESERDKEDGGRNHNGLPIYTEHTRRQRERNINKFHTGRTHFSLPVVQSIKRVSEATRNHIQQTFLHSQHIPVG